MRQLYNDENKLKAGFDAEAKFSYVTKDTRTAAGESEKDELQASGSVNLQIEMQPLENLKVELHDRSIGNTFDASNIVLHYQAGPVNISLGNVELPGIREDTMDGILVGYSQSSVKVEVFAGSETNISGGSKLNGKETIKGINAETDVAGYHLGFTHIGSTDNRKERNELSVEGSINAFGGLLDNYGILGMIDNCSRANHDAEGNPVTSFKLATDLNDSGRNKAEIEIEGLGSIKYEKDDSSYQSVLARAVGYATAANRANNEPNTTDIANAARNTESWKVNYEIADGVVAEFKSENFKTDDTQSNNRNYKREKLALKIEYDDFE